MLNEIDLSPIRKRFFLSTPSQRSYSVMQSDGTRFCGDVVMGSFNMAYGHEDNGLDQKYEKQISRDRYYKDLKFWK